MGFKTNLFCGVATMALFATQSYADGIFDPDGELPAVSGVNGKLEGAGGFFDDEGRVSATGSLTLPIGHDFGAQVDGRVADYGGDFAGGVAGHLFMRDPSAYLLGASAMYQSVDSNDIFRIGPEVELYLGQFSIEFWGGYEDSDAYDGEFFATGDLAWYPGDNFRISAGYTRTITLDAFQAGAEWMPQLGLGIPLSLFVNAQVGENNYESVWAGIRFYFGSAPDKSLIRRHREDDPSHKFDKLERIDECDPVILADAIADSCGNPIGKAPPPKATLPSPE